MGSNTVRANLACMLIQLMSFWYVFENGVSQIRIYANPVRATFECVPIRCKQVLHAYQTELSRGLRKQQTAMKVLPWSANSFKLSNDWLSGSYSPSCNGVTLSDVSLDQFLSGFIRFIIIIQIIIMAALRRQQLLGFQPKHQASMASKETQWASHSSIGTLINENLDLASLQIFPPLVIADPLAQLSGDGNQGQQEIDNSKIKNLPKAFHCDQCQKFYQCQSSLNRHLKSRHSKAQIMYLSHKKFNGKFQCQACNAQFTHTYNLKGHIVRKHQGILFGGILMTDGVFKKRKPRKRALRDQGSHNHEFIIDHLEQLIRPFPEITRLFIKDFKHKIPLLINLLVENSEQSPFEYELTEEIEVFFEDLEVIKIYRMADLLRGVTYQARLLNEFAITQKATQLASQNLLQLKKSYISVDHIALKFKRYQYDLRDYLRECRQAAKLNEIFLQILDGIKQVHQFGYIHRDLKPDNIVLNIEPLEVVIIDFNRAVLDTTSTEGSLLGTQGYFPSAGKWVDGSSRWDIWAYAAMVLEADMSIDEYLHTRDEKSANLHPHTSQAVRDLIGKVFFAKREDPVLTYDEIEGLVRRIKFRNY